MNNKIVIFTRNKPDETLAQYQRILKLKALFERAFNDEVIIFNTYEDINKIKLILNTRKRIKEYLNGLDKKVYTFVIDILDPFSISLIRKYAYKHNIKVYIDIVEEADPKEKKFGILSPSLIMNHYMIRHSVKQNMTVLAISSYFMDYYSNKGIKDIYIPNLLDDEDCSSYLVNRSDNKVNFIFAGYPQKKDALDMIVSSLLTIKKERDDFVLHIAGIDKYDFFKKYPELENSKKEIESFITFHGTLTREGIKGLYYQSDYSIILRDPNMLVTKSGFPTKFVESLMYARPVISNLTSDIGLYLKDEYNGYIVDSFDVDSLTKVIRKALDNKEKRGEMFVNALSSAKENFSPSKYLESLRK